MTAEEQRLDRWMRATGRTLIVFRGAEDDTGHVVICDMADSDKSPDEILERAWVHEEIDPVDIPWDGPMPYNQPSPGFWEWLVERLDATRVGWEER